MNQNKVILIFRKKNIEKIIKFFYLKEKILTFG
jgi:hypothetical protein